MIDIRKLKELVRLMVDNELTEIDLRDNEEQVTLRRGGAGAGLPIAYAAAPPMLSGTAPGAPSGTPGTAARGTAGPEDGAAADDGLVRIECPMVGTFYAAGSPDAAPFATAGTVVSPQTTVCIIEAMKIFNEIKAEVSGTIEKVLVRNGEPVEYGQPLFLVRPA